MIRFSTNNDIEGIVSLWQEAFGDSENEIIFFLKNNFRPENTLVVEENSNVVSMLFLLEGFMRIDGADYPSYYLYAACTSKNCRGRGLMSKLLEFAANIAKNRNVNFICLMPGEKGLFDYYSKHGYLPVFSKQILEINRSQIEKYEFIFREQSNADSEFLRNSAFSNSDFFKWNLKSIHFAFEHTKLYGGQVLIRNKGYALYSKIDSNIVVKEFTFTPDCLRSFTSYLKDNYLFDKVIFHLPAEYPSDIGEQRIIRSAMLLPITDTADALMFKINNAYLGLTLD